MTVTALCRLAGISRGTPARWRRGETQPTIRIIRKLEEAARGAKTTT